MNNKMVNVAIQVLPISKSKAMYDIVDAAIDEIAQSGLKYEVTPFETVVEGVYADVMDLVGKVQERCYAEGANDIICNLKIQSRAVGDVFIDDKIGKYS